MGDIWINVLSLSPFDRLRTNGLNWRLLRCRAVFSPALSNFGALGDNGTTSVDEMPASCRAFLLQIREVPMMPLCRSSHALALVVPVLVSGCAFHPKTVAYNDPECNVDRHKLELQVSAPDCSGGCAWAGDPVVGLATILVMAGGTFIVSESYVLVGNSELWLEKSGDNYRRKRDGRCKPTPSAEKPPGTTPQANAASSIGAAP
jgi:hypothetical protein